MTTPFDLVMSRHSYASQATALRAAATDPSANGHLHILPSGRICYWRMI